MINRRGFLQALAVVPAAAKVLPALGITEQSIRDLRYTEHLSPEHGFAWVCRLDWWVGDVHWEYCNLMDEETFPTKQTRFDFTSRAWLGHQNA